MRNLKAIGILFAAILLFWLGMPGVAFLSPNHLKSPAKQSTFRARWGEPWTTISIASAELNRFRLPIARALGGLQPVFRVSQAWHLYRDGPRTIRRMEIVVDGERVYRTNDPTLDWRSGTFRNRRIRPMAESLTIKPQESPTGPRGELVLFIADGTATFLADGPMFEKETDKEDVFDSFAGHDFEPKWLRILKIRPPGLGHMLLSACIVHKL